jgi:uncharacterized membrane protein YkvA (DUF1232 family)
MTSRTSSIPDALNRHLSSNDSDEAAGLANYLDRGADLITSQALAALRDLRKPLHAKIAALAESERLRGRIELLAAVFEEACTDGHAGTRAHREIAFALLYFLKGVDRIPDTIPEIGLLDDAMVVQIVLQRHQSAIRAHFLRRGLTWSDELE